MSLADSLPSLQAAVAASPSGAKAFASNCAPCHNPPGLTGEPVALGAIGTDPTLGESADRGTGAYRVASLRGVGSRGALLHDGTLPSLDWMFDPTRTASTFATRLHGEGAVPGHVFGLDLLEQDRDALLNYLRAL